MNEVRELSLREVQSGSFGARERRGGARHGVRRTERDRTREIADRRQQQQAGNPSVRDASARRDGRLDRQVEHQSSLRSLLSASDVDSSDMQEEILRQITEEGLLDGIDLDNLQAEQEDEISERIAQAYRRRQREIQSGRRRAASSQPAARSQRGSPATRDEDHGPQARVRSRSSVADGQSTSTNGAEPTRAGNIPTPDTVREIQRQPERSATDLAVPRNVRETRDGDGTRTRSQESRRSTDPPPGTRISEQWRRGAAGVSPQPPAMSILVDDVPPDQASRLDAVAISNSSTAPAISCKRCSKAHIEYDLHYSCPSCSSLEGTYSLCRRCYLEGKGCLHWFGFGYAAWQRYERQAPPGGYPPGTDTPHNLQPRRYIKQPGPIVTLHNGVFCDICHNNANTCYWRCGYCNDGEWGFCNGCVSQAKHCTHPLLALALSAPSSPPPRPQPGLSSLLASSTPTDPPTLTALPTATSCNICSFSISPSQSHFHCPTCNNGDYDICNQCYSGLVSSGRISAADGPHGWRRCPSGHRMLVIGFVEDDAVQNLRRAVVEPVVGGWSLAKDVEHASQSPQHAADGRLDTSDGAQQRRAPAARAPPVPAKVTTDGVHAPEGALAHVLASNGYGTRVLALWTRVPDAGEGAVDELCFPRNAEVTEVEDINGDWYCGVYCRRRGLFPAPYGRVVMS
ncbi:hypothetical protein FH972_021445 [Carpinus fangiana]|uniref:SH3 domain-containing protein n=1 Tax=Carpinus fangiana TaxID=176857 RepID=A0A5N6KPE6_9ROSI|nr:hypothetical protein FH972_021445 [Carpinus fangiana]